MRVLIDRRISWSQSAMLSRAHMINYTSWLVILYTVSHKNVPLCFLIITLAFLGRFLYFLHKWKDEGILYIGVNKIYQFSLSVSPHYLVKLKRHIQHILKSIITVRSIKPVVRNLHRKLSNVLLFQFLVENSFISLLWEKFSHSHRFLIKKFKSIFKLNVFNLKKWLHEANFCDVRRDAIMTSSSH